MNNMMVIRMENHENAAKVSGGSASTARVLPAFTKNLSFEMDERIDDLILAISIAKSELFEVTTTYINGANEAFSQSIAQVDSAEKKRRLGYAHAAYVQQCKKYQKELTDFCIEGISAVVDKGIKYTRHEPVRNLTEIHMQVLQEEVDNFKSPVVRNLHDEYMVLVKSFVSILYKKITVL